MHTNIKSYLDIVCEQIRYEKAHIIIKKELEEHITDQTDAFIAKGMEQETAIKKAITEMGDPILVGTELDRVYRPKLKWEFILFVFLFLFANIAVRFIMQKNSPSYMHFFTMDNIIILLMSVAVMAIFYYIDFTILANHSKMIYGIYVAVMLLLYGYSMLFGYTFNGSNHGIFFLNYGIIIPPFIYIFPVILVGLLYDCRGKSYGTMILCGCSFLIPALIEFNKGHDIAILLVAIISLILLLMNICKGWFSVNKMYALLLVIIPTILFLIIICHLPQFAYKLSELHFAITEPMGGDYVRTILQANVKGAVLFGKGNLGNFDNIFFLNLDYLLAYVLHFYGWAIFLLFFAIYFFFICRGFLLAYKQKSQLGFMTANAILITISLISIWNIACNSGFFIYVNQLEMPFFPSSGSSNIMFFMLMGILLSVFRTGDMVTENIIKYDYFKQNFVNISENTIHISIPIPFKKNHIKQK